jgi:hydroxymethylbilane synthase
MPDGSRILRAEHTGAAADAEPLGRRLADDLLAQGADQILAATQ